MRVVQRSVAGVESVLRNGVGGIVEAAPIGAGSGDGRDGVAKGKAILRADQLIDLEAVAVVDGGGAAGEDGVIAVDVGQAVGTQPGMNGVLWPGVNGKSCLRSF